MPSDELVAVIVWVTGLLLFLFGLLVIIGRLASYRYSGRITVPFQRGIAPLLVGLAFLSVSLFLLGIRKGIVYLWVTIGAIGGVVYLIWFVRST